MIAIDTNLLVYAHREDSPFHLRALECIESLANNQLPWAVPWPCVHEFYAIVTHPRIYAPPTPVDLALDQIDTWLESPTLVLLGESDMHWQELRGLIAQGRIAGPQVHDARIAALCQQHGVKKLWTADRNFSRFPQLACTNPLVVDEKLP